MAEGYKSYINKLDELRQDVAIFRKVILHSHSPNSHDYGKSILNSKAETAYLDENKYIEALDGIKIDVLAITDHMKSNLACSVKCALCILPGMEVNLLLPPPLGINKLHILVIFPQGYSFEKINKIIPPSLPDENIRDGHEVIEMDLNTFIKSVHNCGGICIAAHIDSNNGIRKTFRQLGENGIVFYAEGEKLTAEQERQISEQYKDWLLKSDIDAIEVSKVTDVKHYRWISESKNRKVSIAAVIRNDSHRIEEIDIPERINYIKMTKVCFDDLQRAMQFPLTRIRFYNDVPEIPCPRILGIEITGVEKQGFFDSLQIAFSDNLSCLIGPRGSGKSTVIEAIRYNFDLNKHLKEFEKAGKELAERAISLQNATLTDCIIRIGYIGKDKQLYILEAAYDTKQNCTTRVFDINGNVIEVQDIEANFPIRLFGWSEIETLGRETKRQRELLDQMILGLSEDLKKRKDLRTQVELKRNEINTIILKLYEILNREEGIIKKYKEYKADFEKLNTEEIQNLFKDIDNTKNEISVLTKLKDNIIRYINEIEKYKEIDLFKGIQDIIDNCNDKDLISLWWNGQNQKISFVESQKYIEENIFKIVTKLNEDKQRVQLNIDLLNAELIEKENKLRVEIGEDDTGTLFGAERRRIVKGRLENVELIRRDYFSMWKTLLDYLNQWASMLKTVVTTQMDISDKRAQLREDIESKLNKYSSDDMKISIEFIKDWDKQEFIQNITDSGIFTQGLHGNWRANQWPQKIGILYTPIEFALIVLGIDKDYSIFDKHIEISGQDLMLDDIMKEKLMSTLNPINIDNDAEVPIIDKQKAEKILKLAGVNWDDHESIMLNGKPVASCSPGQRSSAMLPLIALVEDIPLIIDQPEDNLDNKLVGKMLVDILSGLKEKRQIIVSTHNPNIVVSGDAEQVIVLDAISDTKGKEQVSGSIDKKEIIKAVIDIMEGGAEAFINRSRRYHIEN